MKFRLKETHYVGDSYLLGDKENEHLGDEKGTIVGDGTPHVVRWPTLCMEPLDDEAREAIEKERMRLEKASATMNPVDLIPMNAYEAEYVPGTNARRRPPRPDGA